jgi:hypothetical protein
MCGGSLRQEAGSVIDDDEHRQLETLHAQLLAEYGPVLGEAAVSDRFAATVADFDDAPIRTFVPLLTDRFVRQELRLAASH